MQKQQENKGSLGKIFLYKGEVMKFARAI